MEILHSFTDTYFFTNENPYGRSLSLRRDTYIYFLGSCEIKVRIIAGAHGRPSHPTSTSSAIRHQCISIVTETYEAGESINTCMLTLI